MLKRHFRTGFNIEEKDMSIQNIHFVVPSVFLESPS